jgi:hypothetical protein
MDDVLMERAKGYRVRAEEARTAADNMRTQGSRESLRRIAEDYDLLADTMERRAARTPARQAPTRINRHALRFESPASASVQAAAMSVR